MAKEKLRLITAADAARRIGVQVELVIESVMRNDFADLIGGEFGGTVYVQASEVETSRGKRLARASKIDQ